MPPRYPLATSPWGDEEVEAAISVLRSGMTTMGRHVSDFESTFCTRYGCKHAVMVNSGSSANLLMIAALHYTGQLPRGSRVAVPAVSWSTTYAPLQQFGMRLVMVDVDDSLNINPSLIPDVDLIFAVNLLGNPCDFDSFPNVPVIEDNCESMGAVYGGKHTGTIGKMGSFSMFFSHHMSTMEGGMVVTDDDDLWRMLLMLRAHGWTRDLPDYEPGFDSFEFEVPGYSVRPTEVQGAIGREQLKKLPAMLEQRKENGRLYQSMIGHQRENGESSWFGFPVLAVDRAKVLQRLEGVEVRPIVAGNILRHRMAGWFDMETMPTPMADRVHDHGFFVGNHPYPLGRELGYVASALREEAA